jgi:MarR family transcriptional regulator, organic hydroperoxide resistance regulator
MRTKPRTDIKIAKASSGSVNFPLEMSVGYQVRMTHRALQRYLQGKIEPYGVTLGMWYFLRALWHEDGLTQRELSRRIGIMEPTTLNAILTMERSGLVKRVRNKVDKRKIHIHLIPKGRKLKDELLPLAVSVVNTATKTLSSRETTTLLKMLSTIRSNLGAESSEVDE